MHKLNIAVVGTCLTVGAFAMNAAPSATLDAFAMPHGTVAVQTARLTDGLQMSSERPKRSTLTLPSDPKAMATARLSRYLTPKAQAAGTGRIAWHINDAFAAYKEAVALNKPLVLVFGISDCGFCKKMLTEVLPCNGVERFAGRAVFAYSELGADKAARHIGAKLMVTQAPTITVIEPHGGRIAERARISGYFSARQVSADLERFLPAETSSNGTGLPVVKASATAANQPAACSR